MDTKNIPFNKLTEDTTRKFDLQECINEGGIALCEGQRYRIVDTNRRSENDACVVAMRTSIDTELSRSKNETTAYFTLKGRSPKTRKRLYHPNLKSLVDGFPLDIEKPNKSEGFGMVNVIQRGSKEHHEISKVCSDFYVRVYRDDNKIWSPNVELLSTVFMRNDVFDRFAIYDCIDDSYVKYAAPIKKSPPLVEGYIPVYRGLGFTPTNIDSKYIHCESTYISPYTSVKVYKWGSVRTFDYIKNKNCHGLFMVEYVKDEPKLNTKQVYLKQLLSKKDEIRLVWGETWPSCNLDHEETDAHIEHAASISDCIDMQRLRYVKQDLNPPTDIDLLDEFIAVHWAGVFNPPDLTKCDVNG